jgi:hypothetical protein
MSFFKKLSNLFASSGASHNPSYWIKVKCDRCGEIIRVRIDLHNDLSINFGENEQDITYFCRKMLMGSQHCYQQIEVELTFDAGRKLAQQEIHGGKFIEEGKS